MNRVVVTMLIIIAVITAIIVGSKIYESEKYEARIDNIEQNDGEISQVNEEIYDECTDEWEEMNGNENETLQVNSNYEKEEKYIIKELDGVVAIYKQNDQGEELYDLTDISVDYLPEDDKQNLKNGIEVIGLDSLNQLIEDYE